MRYKPKDAEALMHNTFYECNKGSEVNFKEEEAFYYEQSKMALITIITSQMDFAETYEWCVLWNLEVKSMPGMRGFRQTTHVELENKFTYPCKVTVNLAGCTALQSAMIIISPTSHLRFEFYCHGNATGNLLLRAKGEIRTVVLSKVGDDQCCNQCFINSLPY